MISTGISYGNHFVQFSYIMLVVSKRQESRLITSATQKEVVLNTISSLVIQQPQKWLKLRLSEKQITTFLFVVQSIGAAFVGIFLAAYLAGLPTTTVYHGDPIFRIPLIILGMAFLVMILSAFVLAALSKKE